MIDETEVIRDISERRARKKYKRKYIVYRNLFFYACVTLVTVFIFLLTR